ncbi:TIGR02530 family flagellar biosynthesis protein [Litchfieldia salsa]|uniref:Flagellar operon protein n=1 Tax=Litchfieldia salsa TaxID=930152 RepID=A0A1H0R6Z2_9BACI|nr:TIGR02530 family flagellar biosynthesis protein [Litchfieldia salsa]SDP25303.1 flagellar operon protein [Litchfieldia salsa]
MNNRINVYKTHPLSMVQKNSKSNVKENITSAERFQDILKNASVPSLKVSKHAQKRLDERNISLKSSEWNRISELMNDARAKGINDSLVLTNGAALIINAKNNTVITAMDRSEAKAQIFTNINGTIILD